MESYRMVGVADLVSVFQSEDACPIGDNVFGAQHKE